MNSMLSVETSQLAAAANKLRALATSCHSIATRLDGEEWYPAGGHATIAFTDFSVASSGALLVADGARGAAYGLLAVADHLEQARDWYEQADDAALAAFTAVSDTVVSNVVVTIVDLASIGAALLLPAVLTPAGITAALAALSAGGALVEAGVLPDGQELAAWWQEHSHELANPATVLLVRLAVSASDETLNRLLPGAGIAGFDSPQQVAGGAALLAGAGAGAMHVHGTERSQPAAPVHSMADLAATIPNTDGDGAHTTITEYVCPDGSSVYLVSVAGTSSTELGGTNGMDNLSNLAAYAGMDAQSLAAVRQAMADAGIEHGDKVLFSGYSQGALDVAQLARSGDWDTQAVLLAGTPMHGNEIGGDIPVVQLEHDGDLITGLQGITGSPQSNVVVVRRDPLAEGASTDLGALAPHALNEYQHTAAEFDASLDPAAVEQRDEALASLAGATPRTTTDYRYERDPVFTAAGGVR